MPDRADALPGGEGGALLGRRLRGQDDVPPPEALRPTGQRYLNHNNGCRYGSGAESFFSFFSGLRIRSDPVFFVAGSGHFSPDPKSKTKYVFLFFAVFPRVLVPKLPEKVQYVPT